jgi:hypothetical protein
MSHRIYISKYPHRTIALAGQQRVLFFRQSPTAENSPATSSVTVAVQNETSSSRCAVEFAPIADLDPHEYESLSSAPIHGALGLMTINSDVFLAVVTSATQVANIRPGETVQKIVNVEFFCINSDRYDYALHDDYNVHPPENSSLDGLEDSPYQQRRDQGLEHPYQSVKKLLSGGSFYFTTNFDLTNRIQDRYDETQIVLEFVLIRHRLSRAPDNTALDINDVDDGFLWNAFMIDPLLKFRSHLAKSERREFDNARFLTTAIRGFVESVTIPVSASPIRSGDSGHPSVLSLVSRLSCRRAGTRFNSRGIDDNGNVANFVETETILWLPSGLCFSYVQVRGSVPIFWEQAAGLLPNQQKITITRSAEATQPAFDKHFERLEMEYGVVHIVNLLSESKSGEVDLTERYRYHVRNSSVNKAARDSGIQKQLLQETVWDFHAFTKGPTGYEAASSIRHLIDHSVDSFGYYLSKGITDKAGHTPTVDLQQQGTFRTNCLDCLDRTNLIQTIISQAALESFFNQQGGSGNADFWMRHSAIWADNGDVSSPNLTKQSNCGRTCRKFTRAPVP